MEKLRQRRTNRIVQGRDKENYQKLHQMALFCGGPMLHQESGSIVSKEVVTPGKPGTVPTKQENQFFRVH
jgi:hypothetical protein